jgi:hypothetical protein
MSIQFKPGGLAGMRATSATGPARAAREGDARRFADCLATGHGERDARDEARQRRPPVPRAAKTRVARLPGRPGIATEALAWRLTGGRFAGLVVEACRQPHALCITLIPVNAAQHALALRHRARIEAACAACFAGPLIVTWRDAADPA